MNFHLRAQSMHIEQVENVYPFEWWRRASPTFKVLSIDVASFDMALHQLPQKHFKQFSSQLDKAFSEPFQTIESSCAFVVSSAERAREQKIVKNVRRETSRWYWSNCIERCRTNSTANARIRGCDRVTCEWTRLQTSWIAHSSETYCKHTWCECEKNRVCSTDAVDTSIGPWMWIGSAYSMEWNQWTNWWCELWMWAREWVLHWRIWIFISSFTLHHRQTRTAKSMQICTIALLRHTRIYRRKLFKCIVTRWIIDTVSVWQTIQWELSNCFSVDRQWWSRSRSATWIEILCRTQNIDVGRPRDG